MGYLKIVSYLYLVVAVFFIYDGIMKIKTEESYVLSFLFAGLAVFMFFFRMRFAKKMQDKKRDN
jgi:ABC-type polysaccharide/polyol phosphate export permease